MKAKLLLCVALFAGVVFVSSAHAQTPAPLSGLDAYVATAMAKWQVPGLAIAVVKDGKIVFARGTFDLNALAQPAALRLAGLSVHFTRARSPKH